MIQGAIETIRAGLEPGAPAEVKAKAATLLRAVLAIIEGPGAAPVSPDTRSGISTCVTASATPHLLDRFFDRVRAYVPSDVLAEMPRFKVPIVIPEDYTRPPAEEK